VFVVPKFKAIFADVLKGAPLPPLTALVLAASDFVRGHFLLLAGILGAGVAGVKLLAATRSGTRGADWLRLHLPLVGGLLLKAAIARFTRTLGTLMASGVPILQALLITRETSGSVLVAAAVTSTHDRVKAGEPLAVPLAATRLFPPMVSSMVEVGEETGALAEMLVRVADIYDDEVDNAVAGLTSLIEPVMIVFLALVVGTVVIALFLPIVRILQMMG
jgi:type IV pilus assembly protein PilC